MPPKEGRAGESDFDESTRFPNPSAEEPARFPAGYYSGRTGGSNFRCGLVLGVATGFLGFVGLSGILAGTGIAAARWVFGWDRLVGTAFNELQGVRPTARVASSTNWNRR